MAAELNLHSPFPGMDPYLEEPALWPGVHSRLINMLSDMLTEQVIPHFVVRIEERVYITDATPQERQAIVPDLHLLRTPLPAQGTEPTALITPPLILERMSEPVILDRYLTIRDARSREVVTTIEILSPFNKTPGSQGATAFRRKRDAVMQSPTHWIEIDLLRSGERPTEVAGLGAYYTLLKRGDQDRIEVWPISLRDLLPTIAVPLTPDFPDLPLNLQTALEQVYRRGAFALDLDYSRPAPSPALNAADAQWAAMLIGSWRTTHSTA